MDGSHVLLVTIPAQGHINPSLRFANHLVAMGIQVTFATSVFAHRRMEKNAAGPAPDSLSFVSFSDGYDNGFKAGEDDAERYMAEIKRRGSTALRDIILDAAGRGRPVTCLVYTILLHWASDVARELGVPYALLWIQPAAVLDLYYCYFNGVLGDVKSDNDPSWSIRLPGLPQISFSKKDLPSFVLPSSSDRTSSMLGTFKEQLETLDAETRPKVLVNTFDALEPDALRAIQHYDMIGVGPLMDTGDSSSLVGDLFQKSDNCVGWLDSKPNSSVVYVSFGSLLKLDKQQLEAIAEGLLGSGRPFLWVLRSVEDGAGHPGEGICCQEELRRQGKIVGWCPQVEVLAHSSVGCFVTHCGWNSTIESLWCGVPVVAFPRWSEQAVNAKLIEDVWGTGVRVEAAGELESGSVSGEEITRCIERVMDGGEKSREVREKAARWKDLAREAVAENGSSYRNLKAFLEEVGVVGNVEKPV